MIDKYDEAFSRVDAANTAQRVYYEIKKIEQQSDKMRTRWIWELLQNAHDARRLDNNELFVEIRYNGGELEFLHNGRGFTEGEIAHLIASGSTKDETDETTRGQYGTGFLTTYLLSPELEVSGQLDHDHWFNFSQVRRTDSKDALGLSLDEAKKAFKSSISLNKPSELNTFTTRYRFPINSEYAKKAVERGIETLKKCAPFIVIFNQVFSRIKIRDHTESLYFQTINPPIPDIEIQQITVIENRNGNSIRKNYLLGQNNNKTSIIVPWESDGSDLVCRQVEKIPRIFWDFPLVGTESFSFPAVINSPNFTALPDRDSIPLGSEGNDANIINRSIIEEACELLVKTLQYAVSEGWHHAYRWIVIPVIQDSSEETRDWLERCILENLIEKIRDTPTILNKKDDSFSLNEAILPVVENTESVKYSIGTLWDLLNDWQEYHEKLPKRNEAMGWCQVIHNWQEIFGKETITFDKTIDGNKLALHLELKTKDTEEWGNIQNLSKLLHTHVCEVEWLNRLYIFLNANGFNSVIRNHRIVPNQEGWFRELSTLHRDLNIDEKLKEIDNSLGLRTQWVLRDSRMSSLEEEIGVDDADNDYILSKLIEKLHELADNESVDDNYKNASTQLFSWIVGQEDWKRLRDVPVFTIDKNLHRSLSSATSNKLRLLAPIQAWDKELQQYADLFPPERILDDAFFDVLPDPIVWQKLDTETLIRANMVVRFQGSADLKYFSPDIYESDDDASNHKAMDPISRSQVVAWQEIVKRVRDSADRARLFWRFLTEWLIREDTQSLEEKYVKCKSCGDDITHKYYPNGWLMEVRKNRWIRHENKHLHANEKSIANLFRDCDWGSCSLDGNSAVVKLLRAMDLDPSVLKLEFLMAGNEEKRDEVLNLATTLHNVNQDDLKNIKELVQQLPVEILNQLCTIAPDLKKNRNLIENLKATVEEEHILRENQHLGQLVEDLVRKNLEDNDFYVSRTGSGSDFEISTEDIITLDIGRGNKSWLVEVKATRKGTIRMTPKQAQTAVEKSQKFLLCVVPIEFENTTPDLETVRKNMRFIRNIGPRVAPLHEKLKRLESLQMNINAEVESEIRLVCEAGTSRIRISNTVWENEGIPLENLTEHLR